jgi:threonine dehydrogenase-like Zn-dependent dehydrogenase
VPSYITPPLRPAAAGELVIGPEVTLVSPGTELHYLRRATGSGQSFPLGYCAAGQVLEVGPGSLGFAVGDGVIAMGWGQAVHGTQVWVPYRLCVRLPVGLDAGDAVVATLAATAVHALDRSGAESGAQALVVGAGIVGLLVAQVAAARGMRVTVIDRDQARARAVDELGRPSVSATSWEHLGDEPAGWARRHVFMCLSGDGTQALRSATTWAAGGGPRPVITAVGRFVASTEFSVDHGNLDYRVSARCGSGYRDPDYELGRKEVAVPAGEGTVTQNLRRALDLVERGLVSLRGMRVYEGHFDHAGDAYQELLRTPSWATARLAYR